MSVVSAEPERLDALVAVGADVADDLERWRERALTAAEDALVGLDHRLSRLAAQQQADEVRAALGGLPDHLRALDDQVAGVAALLRALDRRPRSPVVGWLLDALTAGALRRAGADADQRAELRALRDASPAEVAAAFAELDAPTAMALARSAPALVGRLDGAPAAVRDHANRSLLERELRQATARHRGLEAALQAIPVAPGTQGRRAAARAEVVDQQRRLDTLTELRDGGAQLLVFDPAAGRVVAARGDVDRADHVATIVPGTGADLDAIGDYLDRAADLVRAAGEADPLGRTAAIAWIDYDAPPTVAHATSPARAEAATDALASFTDGLAALRPDATRTIVAHSYGSTVLGATARDHRLAVDAVVGVGSPGMRVGHADDLQLPEDGRVYTVTDRSGGKLNPFSGDVLHTVSDGAFTSRLGRDPVRAGFGADTFDVDDAGGHALAGYLDPAPTSRSGSNFGALVTGSYERLR